MYITKKHLSRRTVLAGGSAAVALPLLDAMVPASTAIANTAAAPKPRMGFFYLPHGAIMDNTSYGAEVNAWTPEKEGPDFDLKPILKPLDPFRQYLTVVSGLENKPAMSSAVHAITPGTWLSCVEPRKSHAPKAGVTIDQIAAQHIGQDTPLPSIEVASEAKGGSAACDGTYGCSYGQTISFATPTTPLPMEYNPRKLFEKLFGRGDTPEERKEISRDYTSILDTISEEANDLKKSLGPADRAMLDDYLGSVREIERRVQKLEQRDLSKYDLPDLPVGIPDFEEQINLMFDMIALAYQANMTRIATFMMAAEVSNQPYTHIGISEAFHPLSHHNEDRRAIEKLVQVQTWHSQAFARFLKRLSEIPEGEGTVLDNSIFLYGGNMSNSNAHDNFPLPTLVVGGGCGKLTCNQHLRYPDHTPLANLHVTLLNRAGVPVDSVGDSTGELAEV